jgi:hypothetical protein
LEEFNKESYLSSLIGTSFEQLQLEAGTPGHLLGTPPQPLSDATTYCWTKTVWQFAHQHHLTVQDNTPCLRLAQRHDQFIMEKFISEGYKGTQLRDLNHCRKYLRVITLADITTADGKKISANVWKGTPPQQLWHSYEWPRRPPSYPQHTGNNGKRPSPVAFWYMDETTTASLYPSDGGKSTHSINGFGSTIRPLVDCNSMSLTAGKNTAHLASGALQFENGLLPPALS